MYYVVHDQDGTAPNFLQFAEKAQSILPAPYAVCIIGREDRLCTCHILYNSVRRSDQQISQCVHWPGQIRPALPPSCSTRWASLPWTFCILILGRGRASPPFLQVEHSAAPIFPNTLATCRVAQTICSQVSTNCTKCGDDLTWTCTRWLKCRGRSAQHFCEFVHRSGKICSRSS